jgi:pyruvate/2-oxoglutarate dehydrogenase complex dihydrolipoamide dehydrogenase (E3) component
VTSALAATPAADGVGAHSLDTLEVLVVGAGPHPGAEAATIAREIAARLPEGPPGRVVLIAHSPDGELDEPFPVPAHQVGRLLQDWSGNHLTWQATRAELAAVRDELAERDGVAALRRAGVLVVPGRAAFIARNRLELDLAPQLGGPRLVSPASTVIATGTAPAIPDVPGILDTRFHTCGTVLDLPELPTSMVVLGAGGPGCEIAQAFARFGVTVTLVDRQARVLPRQHPDVSQAVATALAADGVRLLLGATMLKVAPTLDGGAWVGTDRGGDVAAETLVLTAGRRPRTAGLDLTSAGITTGPGGAVPVDERLRTASDHVLAYGGVTGLLARGAAHGPMARLTAVNVVAKRGGMRWPTPIGAHIIRTTPTVMQVGPADLDAAAEARGGISAGISADISVGRVAGPTEGSWVQLVVGRSTTKALFGLGGGTGRILLSATLVGAGADEAAGQLVLAANAAVPAAALVDAPAPEGSWAAAVQRAAVHALIG